MTRILGIDPGYDRIGAAIIDRSDHRETLLFSTCIQTPKTESLDARIFFLGKEIERIISEFSPEIVALEKVYMANNQKTVMGVSEARGVIKYIASLHGCTITEYTPMQIKSAMTGFGGATKDQIMWMIPKILTLPESMKEKIAGKKSGGLDDELDAIAVALTASAHKRLVIA